MCHLAKITNCVTFIFRYTYLPRKKPQPVMSRINRGSLLIPSLSLLRRFFKWPATQIQGYVFPCHTARYLRFNLRLKLPAFSESKILPGMEVLAREERLQGAGLQLSTPQHPSIPHVCLFNHKHYPTLV